MYFNEKTAASIIGKMLKQKELKSRPAMQHTWIDEQGRQCSCDGFRAYRLNMPVAGLPDMPAELNAVPLEKIFPDVAKMQALDTPALAELDALIADDNAHKTATKKGRVFYDDDEKRRGFYTYGAEKPVVNIHYLRDMLRIFPDAKTYYTNALAPLLFISQYGDAVLLPVRYSGENADKRPTPAPAKKAAAPAFSLASFAARYAA